MREYIRPSEMDKLFTLKKDSRSIRPSSFIAKANKENMGLKFTTINPKRPMYDEHKIKVYRTLDVLHLAFIQGYTATEYTDHKTVLRGIYAEIAQAENRLESIQNQILENKKQLRLSIGDLSDFGICVPQPKFALVPYDVIVSASKSDVSICGIYFLIKNSEIIYIGQSVNIFSRLQGHKSKDYDSVAFIPCPKSQLDILETLYILHYEPKLNGRLNNRLSTPITLQHIIDKLSKVE